MSHFYGTMQGTRGQATRCGTKNSGMTTIAASWEGAVEVELCHDESNNVDRVRVRMIPWQGVGERYQVFDGLVGIAPTDDDAPDKRSQDQAVIDKLRAALRRVLYCPAMSSAKSYEDLENERTRKTINLALEFAAENDPENKE